MMTVAPSVTYSPPVWQRFLSVHTLLSQVLPVMDTLQRRSEGSVAHPNTERRSWRPEATG